MKLTTQRNLLVLAMIGTLSGFGTCVAQQPTPAPCAHDISVTATPGLLEAIAATCAAACPPADECPDCNPSLTCCEEALPPVPCEPVEPIEIPLEPAEPASSILLDLTIVPQLEGAIAAVGWKRWDRPIWIKAGIGTMLSGAELYESDDYSCRDWDYCSAPAALREIRKTVYTLGAVWMLK